MSGRPKVLDLIRAAHERRMKLSAEDDEVRAELKRFCEAARDQGVSVTLIASEAGLSRQGVYDLLGERPSS